MIAPALTLRAFFDDFYCPLRLRGRSHRTRTLYEFSIRNFARFLAREPTLADFTDDALCRLLAWMGGRGRSPYTINKERSQLLAMWRFACRKGLLAEWPDVQPEIQPERIPRAWTAEELARLFAACLATPGRIGRIQARHWWHALHLLAWDTGERIGPLRQAQWTWIDLDARLIRVPAEVRKGKRADRVYRLHPDTVDALKIIFLPLRAEVFPWPYSENYIYYRYAEIQRRAGLPAGAKFRFHCLRKSVASHGKAAGLDPQELMGHRDGRTTQKYLDPAICGGKQAADVLFRPGK